MSHRLRVLLPALWAGVLLCIGLIAAPAGFATLVPADAGRVAARLFMQEAYLSLALALVLFFIERGRARRAASVGRGSVFSLELGLLLGTLFCTVAGHFALQPLMAAARAGESGVSFATLHLVAVGFFGLKNLLVLVLAWRAAARPDSFR
jgi:Domain of unknown function (DUF4149)